MELTSLNEFSRNFAIALFRAFPMLEGHATVDPDPEVAPGSLLIKYAPNPSHPDREFSLSTDNAEVTIGFDQYHSHFYWPDENIDPLQFITDLMTDRLLVRVKTQHGKWAGSTTAESVEEATADPLEPDEIVYIRSWSGSKDHEIHGKRLSNQAL